MIESAYCRLAGAIASGEECSSRMQHLHPKSLPLTRPGRWRFLLWWTKSENLNKKSKKSHLMFIKFPVCGPNNLAEPLISWPGLIIISVPSKYATETLMISCSIAAGAFGASAAPPPSPHRDNKNTYIWILCGFCWLDAAVIQPFNEIS